MNRKELKNTIKEEQKQLALDIRAGKLARKPENLTEENSELLWKLDKNRHAYRHIHLVYCALFNGTTYESMERNPRNPANEYQLTKLRQKYEAMLEDEAAA